MPSVPQGGTATPGAPVTAVLAPDGIITLVMADPAGGVQAASSNPYYASGDPVQGWGPWYGLPLDARTTPGAPVTAVLTLDGTYTLFMADAAGGVWTASGDPPAHIASSVISGHHCQSSKRSCGRRGPIFGPVSIAPTPGTCSSAACWMKPGTPGLAFRPVRRPGMSYRATVGDGTESRSRARRHDAVGGRSRKESGSELQIHLV
jgi:hypothetical protein